MESRNKKSFKVKLNPHITIYPVEEKIYSREEVKEFLIELVSDMKSTYKEIDPEKWFEQNVK